MNTFESNNFDAEDFALESALMEINSKRRIGIRAKASSRPLRRRDSVELFLGSQELASYKLRHDAQ